MERCYCTLPVGYAFFALGTRCSDLIFFFFFGGSGGHCDVSMAVQCVQCLWFGEWWALCLFVCFAGCVCFFCSEAVQPGAFWLTEGGREGGKGGGGEREGGR